MFSIVNMIKQRFQYIRIKECEHELKVNTLHIRGDFESFMDECGIKYSRITDHGYTIPIKRKIKLAESPNKLILF